MSSVHRVEGTFSSVQWGRVSACVETFGSRAFSSEGRWSTLEGAQNLCVAEILTLCRSGVVAKAWQPGSPEALWPNRGAPAQLTDRKCLPRGHRAILDHRDSKGSQTRSGQSGL